MKSMLHEASSVAKAIEKAWAEAGKPTEFTIKVLEAGEKNFLGLSKRPAIVSITYEPRKQTVRQQDAGKTQDRKASTPVAKNTSAPKPSTGAKDQIRPLPKREPIKPMPQKPLQQKSVQQKPQQPRELVKDVKDKNFADQGELIWQDEWVAFVSKEFKELLAIWGAAQGMSTKVDKKTLTINLDDRLHTDSNEERNACVSFSYLLVQFLKRHYRKKFRGFQLIILPKKNTP